MNTLRGPEATKFRIAHAIKKIENAGLLDVQQEEAALQPGDDLQVLARQVREGRIVAEDLHPAALVEDHPDRAVLEDQPGFPLSEDGHLLVQPQLNKVLRQPLI